MPTDEQDNQSTGIIIEVADDNQNAVKVLNEKTND